MNTGSEDEDRDDSNDNKVDSEEEMDEEQKEEIKRKKKKRPRKGRKHNSRRSTDGTEVDLDEDEIERTVREVNKLLGEPMPSTSQENEDSTSSVLKSKEEILTVQHRNLNPFNELKRIFGSKTVQAEEKFVSLK